MSINYRSMIAVLGAAGLVALSSCSDKTEQQSTTQVATPIDYAAQIDLVRKELSEASAGGASTALAEKKILSGEYISKLGEAIRKGDEELVKTLVIAGALKNATPSKLASLLGSAVSYKDVPVSVVQILIAGGADVNMADDDGITPLFWCAQANEPNKEIWSMLKALGAQFGNKLQTAVLYGDIAAAEAALQEGCSINEGGENNFTPLCLAMISMEPGMFAWVLAKGADANAPIGPGKMSPIFMAARSGREIAVRELAKSGVDINQRDNNEDTPLIRACRGNKYCYPAIRALLECGADVNAVNKQQRSALYFLSDSVYNMDTVENARALIGKGANVNAADVDGVTPLMKLCSCLGSVFCDEPIYDKESVLAMLKLLVDSGADVNVEKKSGDMFVTVHGGRQSKLKMTPMAYAQKYRAVEFIRILKAAGAK